MNEFRREPSTTPDIYDAPEVHALDIKNREAAKLTLEAQANELKLRAKNALTEAVHLAEHETLAAAHAADVPVSPKQLIALREARERAVLLEAQLERSLAEANIFEQADVMDYIKHPALVQKGEEDTVEIEELSPEHIEIQEISQGSDEIGNSSKLHESGYDGKVHDDSYDEESHRHPYIYEEYVRPEYSVEKLLEAMAASKKALKDAENAYSEAQRGVLGRVLGAFIGRENAVQKTKDTLDAARDVFARSYTAIEEFFTQLENVTDVEEMKRYIVSSPNIADAAVYIVDQEMHDFLNNGDEKKMQEKMNSVEYRALLIEKISYITIAREANMQVTWEEIEENFSNRMSQVHAQIVESIHA